MTTPFTLHTLNTAPQPSRPLLAAVEKQFGFIPNLQRSMAESPELLAVHTFLWEQFSKSTLSASEQQVVFMTAIYENDCHYCMAGHTAMAKMQKLGDATITALRSGTVIPDARLEALHRFTTLVVRNRGFVDDQDVQAFLDAGYTRRNILEVILGVSIKVQSNYFNHIAGTPLDAFMKGNEWVKAEPRVSTAAAVAF
ncbi:MAG: carboxymuconolactone decarboxylase family protein [Sphingomicrobium sp.]